MNQRRLFAASVLGFVSFGLVATGALQPVFRTETNFIEVVASVTNKAGEFVTGLTAADFEVREHSRYYVLGYASSFKRQDRVYRELDVKVNRPGLKVHARRGYFPRF